MTADSHNFLQLHNPRHELISSASKENHGSYMISATDKGRYTFCFGNKMSKSRSKVVTFAVQTEHHDPREGKFHILTDC